MRVRVRVRLCTFEAAMQLHIHTEKYKKNRLRLFLKIMHGLNVRKHFEPLSSKTHIHTFENV